MKLKQHDEYTVLWQDEEGLFDASNCKGNGWDTFPSVSEANSFVSHLIDCGIKRETIKVLAPTSEISEAPMWALDDFWEGKTVCHVNYYRNPILTYPTVRSVNYTKLCCHTETFKHSHGGVELDFGSTDTYPQGEIQWVPFEDIGVALFSDEKKAIEAIRTHYEMDDSFWFNGIHPKVIHFVCDDENEDYELSAVAPGDVAYYTNGHTLYRYERSDLLQKKKDKAGIPVIEDSCYFHCTVNNNDDITYEATVELANPETKQFKPLKHLTLSKKCSQCGAVTVWEHPDCKGILLCSSDDIPGIGICRCCLEEHCNTTNCLQCEYGKYPDCKYRYLKSNEVK